MSYYMGKAQRELEALDRSDRADAAWVWVDLAYLAAEAAKVVPAGALPAGRASVSVGARRAVPAEAESHGWPCADDGSEFPAVHRDPSGRYWGECPKCGQKRAEWRNGLLRCTGKVNGKECPTAWPKEAVERLVALSGAGGDA